MPNHPTRDDIDLLDGRWYGHGVHEHYTWMRNNAPVFYDERNDVWALTKYDDIVEASKSPDVFCSSKGMRPHMTPEQTPPSMINMDDPEHKLRRLIVSRGFTPRRVRDHEEQIRLICRNLIAKARETGICDFVHDVAAPLPMIMIGDMLGVKPEDRDQLLKWSDEILLTTTSSATAEMAEITQAASVGYATYTWEVVQDRRANPGGSDLMSLLVEADLDGHSLSDEDLIHESMLILVGGDETTRHVITGGTEALIENPQAWAELKADRSLLPAAIEEMLRWVTPIHNMSRTTTQPVEIRGETIPEGSSVMFMYAAGNRDEDHFSDAQTFDIHRTPNRHIAFGGNGPHFCLGAALARLELRVMFEELLDGVSEIKLDTDELLERRNSNFIVGIEYMPVRVS